MKPSDAYARMTHREIERVPIDELEGRVTAILLTPYPPEKRGDKRPFFKPDISGNLDP